MQDSATQDDYLEMIQKQQDDWAEVQEADEAGRGRKKWAAIGSVTLGVALIALIAIVTLGSRPSADELAFLAKFQYMGDSDDVLAQGYAECQKSTHAESNFARTAIASFCPEKLAQVEAGWANAQRDAAESKAAAEAAEQAAAAAAERSVAIQCRRGDQAGWEAVFVINRTAPDFREAWATPFPSEPVVCDLTSPTLEHGVPGISKAVSATEAAMLQRSATEFGEELGVVISGTYVRCVQHGGATTWSAEALMSWLPYLLEVCPNHPDAGSWNAQVAAIDAEKAEAAAEQAAWDAYERKLAAGTAIASGPYVVGSSEGQMRPGNWRTTSTEILQNCYWERTSGSTGEIIDNYFSSAASKVTVTVRSGETFTSSGCGAWELVG